MELFAWVSALTSLTRPLPHSRFTHTPSLGLFQLNVALYRERREHKVFLELLKCVPGLEERLMNAESEEEVHSIAMMVSSSPFFFFFFFSILFT